MTRFLISLILMLITLALGWFIFFRESSTQTMRKEGPVIFFGNSLTAGVGAGQGEDFPSMIAKQFGLTDVINAAVPGDTTETALNRLQPDVLEHNPSLVVVELSGNDFLGQIPIEETINNLDLITQKIKETGSEVVLVHIKFPRNSGEYEEGFKQISKKHNVKVVWDVLHGVIGNPKLMYDTIHPNAAGYKIMAERIAEVLGEIL